MQLQIQHTCFHRIHNVKPKSISKLTKAYQYDPTRTLTLRNRFVADLTRRFKALKKAINKKVVVDDFFKVKEPKQIITFAYDFPSSKDKVSEFMEWLKEQEQIYLLSEGKAGINVIQGDQIGKGIEKAWTNQYIQSAYQQGILRGRQELTKAGYEVPKEGMLGASPFNSPFHLDRLGIIYSRTYDELQTIIDATNSTIKRELMSEQLSGILAKGISEGRNPLELARNINETVDKVGINRARTIARSEIIHAHTEATLQEYKNAGAIGVKIKAEFTTAGDDLVCKICGEIEEKGLIYALDDSELPKPPIHPNCVVDGNTLITMKNGEFKRIKDVEEGDYVRTHTKSFQVVLNRHHTPLDEFKAFTIVLENKSELCLTYNHPVYIQNILGQDKWVMAGELEINNLVNIIEEIPPIRCNSSLIKIIDIKKQILKEQIVYNLTVNKDGSYIANGVVIHNCRCILLPVDITDVEEEKGKEELEEEEILYARPSKKEGVYQKLSSKEFNELAEQTTINGTPNENNLATMYQKQYFQLINNYLRGDREELGETGEHIIEALDSLISKQTLKQNTILYRGITFTKGDLQPEFNIGNIFKDKAFLSTTTNSKITEKFMLGSDNKFLFEIYVPKGRNVAFLEPIDKNEYEVLLGRGSQFKIIGIEEIPGIGKRTKIIMEVISNAE